MILHHIAAGVLIVVPVHHVATGGFDQFLRKHALLDESGNLKQHNPNAVLALSGVILLWAGAVLLLVIPGVPVVIEMALGSLLLLGTILGLVHRRAPITVRPVLTIASGVLVLAGGMY